MWANSAQFIIRRFIVVPRVCQNRVTSVPTAVFPQNRRRGCFRRIRFCVWNSVVFTDKVVRISAVGVFLWKSRCWGPRSFNYSWAIKLWKDVIVDYNQMSHYAYYVNNFDTVEFLTLKCVVKPHDAECIIWFLQAFSYVNFAFFLDFCTLSILILTNFTILINI